MVLQSTRNKQQGFGLLELMLSMVIVALLLLMVTNYYRSSRNAVRIQEAVTMIGQAYSAAENLANATGNYTGISLASVTPFLSNNSTASPWGSDGLTVSADDSDPTKLVVTLGTDTTSCQSVIDAFQGIKSTTSACDAKGVVTVTFPHNK